MSDLSPGHMQARTTLRQLLSHVSGLYPPSFNNSYPPLPDRSNTELFLPPSPTFDLTECSLVGKWKTYLKWEENNLLEIEDKDKVVFINRVQAVYRKAVIRMRWFSEIWRVAFLSLRMFFVLTLMTGLWHIRGQVVLVDITKLCQY
jgi:cleavage stimulation factor subunit 3